MCCFCLLRNRSVCFGCFDIGSKHRNKPKIVVFGFTKQTETNAKQILFRFVSVRTEIYFCLFRGHPNHDGKFSITWTVVIRFVWVSAKFGTCTVVSVNGTLVEPKMCTSTLESMLVIFNKCPINSHDDASTKFRTSSHETDYSVARVGGARLPSFTLSAITPLPLFLCALPPPPSRGV